MRKTGKFKSEVTKIADVNAPGLLQSVCSRSGRTIPAFRCLVDGCVPVQIQLFWNLKHISQLENVRFVMQAKTEPVFVSFNKYLWRSSPQGAYNQMGGTAAKGRDANNKVIAIGVKCCAEKREACKG